jgi:methionyl-tRNA formyltransferase
MKVIFMGTPEFAVPTLEALYKEHQVVAVYTQVPKPAGRGHKETFSSIHNFSLKSNIPVYTPKSFRNEDSQAEFKALEADCIIVAAYGLILPKLVLNHCKYGCINIHPSSLPLFRGAAPIQRTILAGDKSTSMCIMQMDEGVDTGDILKQEEVKLDEMITFPELSNSMAKLLLEVLSDIKNIIPKKQQGESCYAKKITKEEGELNWNESSENLMRKVRALNPWPGTFFYNGSEKIKVKEAKFYKEDHNQHPGTIIDSKNLKIACKTGSFQPLIVQKPGKNAMKIEDFLKGNKIIFTSEKP